MLVNSSNGVKLLGYVADSSGNIDPTQQLTPNSVLKIPVGTLTSVQQTSNATFQGNLDASSGLQTTSVTIGGELDTSSTPGDMTETIYDANGGAHTLKVTLANPVHDPAAGAGVPAGATQRWDATISVDGIAQPVKKLYAVPDGAGGNNFVFADNANPANPLGSTVALNVSGSAGAPNFPVSVDFSKLQAQSAIASTANGQGGAAPVQSSLLSITGSLNLDGSSPIVNTATVYDASGAPYTVTTTLSNPTVPAPGANVPAGAAQQWQVKVDVTDASGASFTAYDSSAAANQESAVYFVPGTGFVTADGSSPGQSLGSTIQLVAGALPAGAYNQGRQVGTNFPLTIDLSALNTTATTGAADGQTGSSPVSNASLAVYDSLGVKHNLTFQFTRALVGSGAPANATGRWEWTASENGTVVASSATAGNNPLFFDNTGKSHRYRRSEARGRILRRRRAAAHQRRFRHLDAGGGRFERCGDLAGRLPGRHAAILSNLGPGADHGNVFQRTEPRPWPDRHGGLLECVRPGEGRAEPVHGGQQLRPGPGGPARRQRAREDQHRFRRNVQRGPLDRVYGPDRDPARLRGEHEDRHCS